jgi:hypothetical protein
MIFIGQCTGTGTGTFGRAPPWCLKKRGQGTYINNIYSMKKNKKLGEKNIRNEKGRGIMEPRQQHARS